ncbi:hypothetical protein BHE74_00045804 [Ensete ventricosum]|nr:hypothetical protein BHE74_00045804 [Ensete ventricosum]
MRLRGIVDPAKETNTSPLSLFRRIPPLNSVFYAGSTHRGVSGNLGTGRALVKPRSPIPCIFRIREQEYYAPKQRLVVVMTRPGAEETRERRSREREEEKKVLNGALDSSKICFFRDRWIARLLPLRFRQGPILFPYYYALSIQPVKATATEAPPVVKGSSRGGKTKIGINGE